MLDETFQLIRALPGVAGVKSTTNDHGVVVQCRSDANVVSLRQICDNANLALVIEHVEAEITPEEAEIADLPQMIRFTITCLIIVF